MATKQEYWVLTTRGYTIRVKATSPSVAMEQVEKMGHTPKQAGLVSAGAPPTPEETPTDVDYSRASFVGELPPPTGEERFGAIEAPPTPPPSATGTTDDAQTALTTKGRLDQQLADYNTEHKTSYGLEEYLDALMGAEEGVAITQRTRDNLSQQYEYGSYLEFLTTRKGKNYPTPQNLRDYLLHIAEWESNATYYNMGYTQQQIDSFSAFQAYGFKYGNLEDYSPKDLADYLANYDKAQQQLDTWKQEAGPEAVGFTDAQIQEFNAYKQYYYQYGEPGELVPVDVGDFLNRYDEYQQQLGVWQQRAAEVEEYELPPEEAARRREEAYEEGRYAAEERYGEPPQYQPPFTQWLGEQGQFSGALEKFVESQYPSLRSEFQATQPRLTGFPTREEARAEATRREQAWQGWLPGQAPGMYQEYMGQRPAQRGERLWMQAPTLRTANW